MYKNAIKLLRCIQFSSAFTPPGVGVKVGHVHLCRVADEHCVIPYARWDELLWKVIHICFAVTVYTVQVLKAKSCQYLTDYHLWLSAFVKPSYSRFSRSQRLTCCLCLLMSYMTISALWFNHFTTEVQYTTYSCVVFMCDVLILVMVLQCSDADGRAPDL